MDNIKDKNQGYELNENPEYAEEKILEAVEEINKLKNDLIESEIKNIAENVKLRRNGFCCINVKFNEDE